MIANRAEGQGRLNGKVALITGAGGSIGAETARVLAGQGAYVVAADLSLAATKTLVDELNAAGGQAISVEADISQESQVAAMVSAALATFGHIDILHNNAAYLSPDHMMRDGPVTEIDVNHWDRTMAVNLKGTMLCCKHAIPHMITTNGGSIINMASGKAVQGDLSHTAYGTSKAGVIGLTRYVAAQYGKAGIRANVLIVGVILRGADLDRAAIPPARQAQIASYEGHHLTPYLGSPRHVADAVAFLASTESAFVTGAAIPLDGGLTSHSPMLANSRLA
jgi:NAD(P)-dependent dehydrogenase (short-subunit alcohol dehydrogenase family)